MITYSLYYLLCLSYFCIIDKVKILNINHDVFQQKTQMIQYDSESFHPYYLLMLNKNKIIYCVTLASAEKAV